MRGEVGSISPKEAAGSRGASGAAPLGSAAAGDGTAASVLSRVSRLLGRSPEGGGTTGPLGAPLRGGAGGGATAVEADGVPADGRATGTAATGPLARGWDGAASVSMAEAEGGSLMLLLGVGFSFTSDGSESL